MDVFSHLKAAYNWLKRALEVINLYKRVKRLEEKANAKKMSAEAKFCPNCDGRLCAVDTKRFDHWWYKCTKCDKVFQYPAPTAK